jgi:phosphatidylglycerol:prolipoprotein diacylglycerol transferase
MFPVLFKIGPLAVHSYGFLVAVAFLTGLVISVFYAKKEGIGNQIILDLAIYVIISAIVGARIFYVLGQWDYYRSNPVEILMLQNGGLVFLGGLLFSILTVVIYARIKGLPLLKLLDALTPGTALGYAIGRIGCFLNGCCFGLPTKLPWGLVFPPGSLAALYFPGENIHPTQLYSSLSVLLVFFVLFWLYRRKKFDGQILFWGLILYAVYRFLVEFLRYSPFHWLQLTPSQWLSIALFIFGIWGLIRYRKSS